MALKPDNQQKTEHDSGPTDQPKPVRRCLNTQELFGRSKELQIEHNGEVYRLIITGAGKLILKK